MGAVFTDQRTLLSPSRCPVVCDCEDGGRRDVKNISLIYNLTGETAMGRGGWTETGVSPRVREQTRYGG